MSYSDDLDENEPKEVFTLFKKGRVNGRFLREYIKNNSEIHKWSNILKISQLFPEYSDYLYDNIDYIDFINEGIYNVKLTSNYKPYLEIHDIQVFNDAEWLEDTLDHFPHLRRYQIITEGEDTNKYVLRDVRARDVHVIFDSKRFEHNERTGTELTEALYKRKDKYGNKFTLVYEFNGRGLIYEDGVLSFFGGMNEDLKIFGEIVIDVMEIKKIANPSLEVARFISSFKQIDTFLYTVSNIKLYIPNNIKYIKYYPDIGGLRKYEVYTPGPDKRYPNVKIMKFPVVDNEYLNDTFPNVKEFPNLVEE